MWLGTKRRFAATLAKIQAKAVRHKNDPEGGRRRAMVLCFEARLTRSMREDLPGKIQPLVDEEIADEGVFVRKLSVVETATCIVRIFKPNGKGKAIVTLPDGDVTSCIIELCGIVMTKDGPHLALRVMARMNPEVWGWAGTVFGDLFDLEIEPEQPDLPLEEDDSVRGMGRHDKDD